MALPLSAYVLLATPFVAAVSQDAYITGLFTLANTFLNAWMLRQVTQVKQDVGHTKSAARDSVTHLAEMSTGLDLFEKDDATDATDATDDTGSR